jgi:hypothetical protein
MEEDSVRGIGIEGSPAFISDLEGRKRGRGVKEWQCIIRVEM